MKIPEAEQGPLADVATELVAQLRADPRCPRVDSALMALAMTAGGLIARSVPPDQTDAWIDCFQINLHTVVETMTGHKPGHA